MAGQNAIAAAACVALRRSRDCIPVKKRGTGGPRRKEAAAAAAADERDPDSTGVYGAFGTRTAGDGDRLPPKYVNAANLAACKSSG